MRGSAMIVEFVSRDSLDPGAYQGSAALEPERQYVVLEVYCRFGGPFYFRIEHSKNEAPALFDTRLFKITSPGVPPSWCMFQYDDGSLKFGPKSWQVEGFWQAYLDRDEWALGTYETERAEALAQIPAAS